MRITSDLVRRKLAARLRSGLALVLSAIALLCQGAGAAAAHSRNSILPSAVRELISRELPDWRVMELSDLVPDDQRIWVTAHPKKPPGVAVGHFENAHQLAYALNLVREENGQLHQMLVVIARSRKGTYETHKLQEPIAGAGGTVLRLPPGIYSGIVEDKVRIRLDSILYEQLEVSSVLYYWKEGSYHELAISD